jgi:hypothetical protein
MKWLFHSHAGSIFHRSVLRRRASNRIWLRSFCNNKTLEDAEPAIRIPPPPPKKKILQEQQHQYIYNMLSIFFLLVCVYVRKCASVLMSLKENKLIGMWLATKCFMATKRVLR